MLTDKLDTTGEDPFKYDCLDRKKNAEVLNTIIENYKDGFVLAIDGAWGTGKSTFIEMWNKQLQSNGYQTIHFNAWENDFDSNPLTSLLGEINDLLGKEPENGKSARFLSIAKHATLSAAPSIAKALIKNVTGIDTGEIFDKFSSGIVEAYEKDITDYKDKKKNLSTFKTELEKFIPEFCNDKPLIFFVDELDRCRPDYAVEVLEKIKHFFSVKGIIFVLAIDKTQLSNSIRGYYGSDLINADEYLRRFIDIEYALPTPDFKEFCDYLYSKMNLNEIFSPHKDYRLKENIESDFKNFAPLLINRQCLSLRQIEKLFVQTVLAFRSFEKSQKLSSEIVFLLTYLKGHHTLFYNELKSGKLPIQSFIDKIEKIAPTLPCKNIHTRHDPQENLLIAAKILLLCIYNVSLDNPLITESENREEQFPYDWNNIDQQRIIELVKWSNRHIVPLYYLCNKIDLLENLKI